MKKILDSKSFKRICDIDSYFYLENSLFRKFTFSSFQNFIFTKILCSAHVSQLFGREKDGNCGKFIGSNLVIFCYKELEKFVLCKSISQSEGIFIVYSEPIESGQVKN